MHNVPSVVQLLTCQSCCADLVMSRSDAIADDGHVMEGELQCLGCASTYPIHRGVPRFATDATPDIVEATVETFGYQWVHASRQTLSHRFAAAETFLDFIAPVAPEHFRGKRVLDAGCGMGRFTRLAAEFSAATVVGVDFSEAVDPAFDATRHLPNVLIVQADLFALPVKPLFEYVFSVGVLHHTVDPDRAFEAVASRVARSGSMSAWVYGREGNETILRVLNPLRAITSRLPAGIVLGLSYLAALPMWMITKGVYRPFYSGRLHFIGRRLFYAPYMNFLAQFSYRDQAIVIFDHASPQLADYIEEPRFRRWFANAGLTSVVITRRGSNSWRGFGVRP